MILDHNTFRSKAVLVAGAGGGGIGTATCLALAAAGAKIIAVDKSAAALAELDPQLTGLGAEFETHVLDARDGDAVAGLVAALDNSLSGLPHLVNVIGGIRGSDWCDLEQADETRLSEVLDLNLHCAFRLSTRVAECLIRSGQPGSIVNVSSVSAFFATERLGLYAIAKSALEGMTRAMAVNWARHGIRVNAVAPGRVDTPVLLKNIEQGNIPGPESYSHKIPLQRTATPEEIAAPIVFLLSDLASYITGQSLLVDGGASVRFMVQPD